MNRVRSRIVISSVLAVLTLLVLNSGIAQGQSVYDAVCDVIPSLPYYERGDFSESNNCANPFDSVNGSYSASGLNAEQFSPPGDDGNGGYIDITDDGYLSLEWRVEVEFRSSEIQQSYFDDRSDGRCRGFTKDPNFITESPAGATSCIGSEGYSIPYQYGPSAAAGFSRGYAVTPCAEVQVEITIHAGQPGPWERRRDSMEKTIDFATQALTALVNAVGANCSNSSTPPSNPPPSNPPPSNPPSNNTQPTIQIQTSQGTHTLQQGETKNITIPDGTSAEVRAECEGIYYFFLLVHASTDAEEVPFRFTLIGQGALFATLCEWLMDSQGPASAGIVTSQSAHEILEIGVNGSGVRVESDIPVSSVKVSTPTATVSSTGANDFNVEYLASTGESKVSSSQGNVMVSSNNGGTSKNVGNGQEVRVSTNGVGEVAPIGSSSPPGSSQPPSNNPPTRSVSNSGGLAQFDTDSDCMMSDAEFFSVTDSWITEEIGNDLFFAAVDAWISQSSICASATASGVEALKLEAVSLEQVPSGAIFFGAQGQDISSTHVDIYDLKGNLLFSESQSGTSVRWNLRDASGARAANGVYLYRVIVQDQSGNMVNSEVRKLVVLN